MKDLRLVRTAVFASAATLLLVAIGAALSGLQLGQALRLLTICALLGLPFWWLLARLQDASMRRPRAGEAPQSVSDDGAFSTESRQADRHQRESRERQLLGERDPLTGCLNRVALLERLARELEETEASAQSVCCVLLHVEDAASGTPFSDPEHAGRALRLVAELARGNLRDCDLLARWTTQELCVVLPGIEATAAVAVLERIRRTLRDALDHRIAPGQRAALSGGLAVASNTCGDADALLADAQRALEQAREAGGNRIVCDAVPGADATRFRERTGVIPPITDPGFDAVTGLPATAIFSERVELGVAEAARRQRSAAIVLFGVRPASSPAQQEVAEIRLQLAVRLRQALRALDVVGLLGDEGGAPGREQLVAVYGLLVNDLPDPRMAASIVRRVCAQVSEPVEIGAVSVGLAVTAGIALGPADGTEPRGLIAAAARALDSACTKSGRINCEFVAGEMNQVYVDQERFREEFGAALAEDQLELQYLPRFDLATGRATGLEALVRWNHPQRGLLPPAQFVGMAETAGMTVALGTWVLAHAIRDAAAWPAQHRDVVLSVNLSRYQFRQGNLVELATGLLARHGLETERLEIEIAEQLVIQNTEPAVALINRLNRAGVRIAIDDFGTGYALLKYLRRFPANVVKIDRALIADVHKDNRDATIVSAIVSLAGSLGIQTVAEGVETEAQRAALRALGCGSAQGFLLCPPLSVRDIPAFLAGNRSPVVA